VTPGGGNVFVLKTEKKTKSRHLWKGNDQKKPQCGREGGSGTGAYRGSPLKPEEEQGLAKGKRGNLGRSPFWEGGAGVQPKERLVV